MTDAASLMRGHDAFDRIEEKFNEALDVSLDPAGPEVLYEHVAGMELPAGATAIDVGCGEGKQATELSRRFGLQVTGIDPVPRCVEVARGHAQPGDNVSFGVGAAENLPIASASADLVWCRDVLCLTGDLGRAYREFRRVLKPGGRALIYQMFATSLLEPGEAAFLFPVMGCSPAAMRPESTEAAINDAGLRIDRCVILGPEWGEHAQEHAQHPGRHLLHAARLIRDPDRYIARFGQENYDIKLGDCLWHIYRMIGKLSSRVYLLSAPEPAADTTSSRRPAATDEQIDQAWVDGAPELNAAITLVGYDQDWPALFAAEAGRIRQLLGDRVLLLEHVGSTSVPGLAAKPIIDILLVLADPADEPAWLPPLAEAGYRLVIREPGWYQHRALKGPDTNINLHVHPPNSPEIRRHLLFREWLRTHHDDRDLYERTKRELASRTWKYVQNYADAKTEVIESILAKAARRRG